MKRWNAKLLMDRSSKLELITESFDQQKDSNCALISTSLPAPRSGNYLFTV